VEDTAKTDAASDSTVTMGDWLVWGQILDPNTNQDTVGKLSSRISIGVIKIWWFLCRIIQLKILKVQNIAGSNSFWLCPD
jgi:hypothetical protein